MSNRATLPIGNYIVNVNHELGRGSFGTVYKATLAGFPVAVKRISTQYRQEYIPELINFFNRPTSHANIVEYQQAIRQGNNIWLFMEFCENGDLDHYMRNHHHELNDIRPKCHIMLHIAKGLEYLHGQDIVHRDIKPNNILISGGSSPSKAVAKIGDFGLAKCLDQNAHTSAMTTDVGTSTFKAPEFWKRWEGKVRYHRSIDVFSTGLTFLSMLQCNSANRLYPRIENTMDIPDESNKPIGLVMFLREQSNQTSVNVVADDLNDDEHTASVKDIIRKMTRMVPDHRIRAEEIVPQLEQGLLLVGQVCLHPFDKKKVKVKKKIKEERKKKQHQEIKGSTINHLGGRGENRKKIDSEGLREKN